MTLTKDQIIELITNVNTISISKHITDQFNGKLIINSINKKIYSLKETNNTYDIDDVNDDIIIVSVSKVISESWDALSDLDKENIELKYPQKWSNIFKNTFITSKLSQIKVGLTNNDIIFDDYENRLHFNNGYIDLKTGKLMKRALGRHYITKYITRNYKEATEQSKQLLTKLLKQIYTNSEDYEAVLFTIFNSFTGLSRKEQEVLYMTGNGSAGKSTLLKLIQMALPCYFKELASDTFVAGNSKIDKIMNSFAKDNQILLVWINEPDLGKINTALFKKFCEGCIQTTKLYKEGTHDIIHKAKTIFTANELPNIQMDTGTIRRILAVEHKSEFIDDKSLVDNKRIFLKDKELWSKVDSNNDIKNAMVRLIIDVCIKYNNAEKVKIPDSFTQAKDTIVVANDYFQDFIDGKLEITNKDEDRISKDDMKDAYLKMFPNKHANHITIISSLKDRKIEYQPGYRCKGSNIRGCFVGVKFKGKTPDYIDMGPDDIDPLDHGIEKIDNKVVHTIDDQIDMIKQQIENLQNQLQTLEKQKLKTTSPKSPTKKVIKQVAQEDDLKVDTNMNDLMSKFDILLS